MGRALRWTYKLLKAWRADGFRGMIKAGVDRIIFKGEAQDHEFSSPIWTIRDVLFVNGCPPEQAPHPYRYRVLHQMEQLRAAGYTVSEMAAADCIADAVLSANTIVFYRCPYTEAIGEMIRAAKALNKRVVFDIDDLVIDTVYTDTIPAVQAFSRADRALYDEGVNRYGATLRMCEAATTTTSRLGEELGKYVPTVYVNRNCASEKMWQLSEKACRKEKEQRASEEGKALATAKMGQGGKSSQKKKELRATKKVDTYASAKMGQRGASPWKGKSRMDSAGRTAVDGKPEGEFQKRVVLGYFSGTLTHNADFEMIKPAVLRVMEENPQVSLLLMGELDRPKELEPFGDRVIQKPFADWQTLPEIIAGVDLNLAPVEDTVFNEAKSENKWVEAALVKTATVASRMGALAEMIRDGETGFLADDEEWYEVLTEAIRDREKRERVAENAYAYCREHCVTIRNVGHVREIYEQLRAPHAAFVLPSCEISGGIMVALRHAGFLQDAGWNVDLITPNYKEGGWTEFGHHFVSLSYKDGACDNQAYYDLMVATMWTTVPFIQSYPRVGRKTYLVQNYETDFYALDDPQRLECEGLYFLDKNWKYLTISRWCAGWLKERYGQEAGLMKNGLDLSRFKPVERDELKRKQISPTEQDESSRSQLTPAKRDESNLSRFTPVERDESKRKQLLPTERDKSNQSRLTLADQEERNRKIRILIEGDCAAEYKNVDESFRITDRLDREKYEVWYMSYNAQPKEEYRVDRFLHAVPYEQVAEVYAQCDILLKSSWLESFSYPPLEMMATGGACVVAPNGGNSEYLRDGENCLLYPLGDEDAAARAIERIVNDPSLRQRLREGGLETARSRDWGLVRPEILRQYQEAATGYQKKE